LKPHRLVGPKLEPAALMKALQQHPSELTKTIDAKRKRAKTMLVVMDVVVIV
jgi:hypothetical protein